MRKRTKAREFALQILYEMDITNDDFETVIRNFWPLVDDEVDEDVQTFTQELVALVATNRALLDEKIAGYATNWEVDRMAVVDRNVLRLGGCELLYRADIPPKVSINEAVDLAKKFSGVQAGKFVNGILDKLKSERK